MGSRSGELVISDFSNGKLHRVDITDPANMTTEVLVNATGQHPTAWLLTKPTTAPSSSVGRQCTDFGCGPRDG